MRADLARMIEAHRRVLDQLATGVAIFNVDRKLIFYNAAFRSLFELDAALLDQMPTDGSVLDTLRANRKLPEEQDYRAWKQQLYEAYRAIEPREHMWHLPDGRALRVVTAPNPEGGVTYLYDDVTERLAMHRRYDALIKVQSETLDHLAEAVAVFGSRRPRAAAQSGVPAHVEARARGARPASAYRSGDRLGAGDARRQHGMAKLARRGDGDRQPRADRGAHRTARRRHDRHDHHAAAGRRHAGHLPGRHRHGQRRARADREERGAGSRRRHQDRFRAPRLLRIALAAHQHHRLRAFPQRSDLRAAHRQTARISRLHHRLDQRAARAHQQHPRSRHHRRRRHGAQPFAGRHPRHHGGSGRRRAGPAQEGRHHARH